MISQKKKLRILSLLPAATEIAYLLGLEQYLVGVSHDCDYPPQVKDIPRVTFSSISNEMTSLEIGIAVKKLRHSGTGVFHIDEKLLKKLNPNLILTQELCEVCAVGGSQVKQAARILDSDIKIISLEPESVKDILENILLVGEVTGYRLQAQKEVKKLKKRIRNLKLDIRNSTKPKVCVVEWLDPVMIAGHWVPEMVEMAGGKMLITKIGEKSKSLSLNQLRSLKADILIFAPCGFDIKRTRKEQELIVRVIGEIGEVSPSTSLRVKVYLVDGNAYLTRPGPRIVDGIEILAEMLHPEIFDRKYLKKDWLLLEI